MHKLLPVTLLSLLQLVCLPDISLAQPAPTCISPYGADFSTLPLDPQQTKSQQAKEMAEIAIAFLKVGQPRRATQVNEQIRSRFKLQSKDLSTLVMIQHLMAGDQAAATAHLSKLDLTGYGDIDAIFLAAHTLPANDQVDWMLNVVDRLPINNGKLLWWIVLAEIYSNRPGTRKIAEKMRSMLTEDDQLFEWVNLAVVYRQTGNFEAARSLLESLADQARSDSRNLSSRIKIAQEFARIGQPERARTELNQLTTIIVPGNLSINPDLTHHLSLAYAAIGNLTAVSDLIQKLPDKADPDTFSFHSKDLTRSKIAWQFAEQGNIQQSQQFLLSINDSKLQGETAQTIIQHLLQKEKWADAAAIASLAEPKLQALIAYKAAQANQLALSDRILSTMRGENGDIVRLLQTTQALNQVGNQTKARALLKEALALATQQKIQPLLPKIAVQFAEAGDFKQANQLLDEQFRIFKQMPRQSKSPSFEPLILDSPIPLEESSLGRFFEYTRLSASALQAEKSAQQQPIKAFRVQPSLAGLAAIHLGSFATFYSRARNFAKADQLIQLIPDQYCNFKASVLQFVVSEAIAANQLEVAQTLLEKYSRSTNQDFVRANSIAIANLYLDQKQSTKAIPLLEKALNLLTWPQKTPLR
ncbi:MAG: tetratricopeptide repeat protein [Leptolyngbyaceae cyanobacterium CSU_1_3]|nr:tetratricopeptide repeat protein [Leptolyngbyaceae cyanobacterium CSU_1_3]